MRIEINVILFANDEDESLKKIDGFLNVPLGASHEQIIDEMSDFIEQTVENYLDKYSSGVAQMLVNGDKLFHVSFKKDETESGDKLCNIMFPNQLTMH